MKLFDSIKRTIGGFFILGCLFLYEVTFRTLNKLYWKIVK